MKRHLVPAYFLAFTAFAAFAPAAEAVVIATSKGLGADAEVRDHQPTTNFGPSTELATRIVDNFPLGHANDGNDRFSAMYLKFDISEVEVLPNQSAAVRLTYRNTNLTPNRIHDTTPPGNNMAYRTGVAFYGLDRDHTGNNWAEGLITYLNAPGLAGGGDFNNGTKDFDFVDPDSAGPLRAPLVPLGVAAFPEVPPQNRLPVGGELIFSSTALDAFVSVAINEGKPTVTIVAAIAHDGKVPINDWKNFLYLFNPKEQTTLNFDTGYDADVNNPDNPLGSPWSGASNAEDASGFSPFSPQLILGLFGDYNDDGTVNAADYTVWRNRLGGLAALPNDNTPGVGPDDYARWKSNYGQTAGSGSTAGLNPAVPEPTTVLLFVTAMLAISTRRRLQPLSRRRPRCPRTANSRKKLPHAKAQGSKEEFEPLRTPRTQRKQQVGSGLII
jgi:hypothetical protein